jgi:hypothetical protein
MYIRVLTDISKPAASNGIAGLMATSRIEVPKSSLSLPRFGAKVNLTLASGSMGFQAVAKLARHQNTIAKRVRLIAIDQGEFR